MTESQDGPDPIGSVSEEAAKLLGAVADWARDQGPDVGTGLASLAAQAADAARQINEHIATGDEECRYCPICRTVHAVRTATPEVRANLSMAASSFLQAAAGLLAAAAAEPPSDRASPVEHIDLDPDLDPDPGGDP